MKFKYSGKEISVVLAILAVFVLLFVLFTSGSSAVLAHIEHDGERILTLELSGEPQQLAMEHNNNVIIEYGEGGIRFIASDCPDKVCIHTGNISQSGQVAACLPNDIIVMVEGEGVDITL